MNKTCNPPKDIRIEYEAINYTKSNRKLIIVIKIKGLFSDITITDIKSLILEAVKYPHCLFILDCSELIPDNLSVLYMEKSLQLFMKNNFKGVFCGIATELLEAASIIGLSQFYNITESVESAITKHADDFFSKVKGSEFPMKLRCPICSKIKIVKKACKIRCRECKTLLSIDQNGKVYLG